MLAFVFPGQGSQHPGMGGDLFDRVKEFVTLEQDIDAVLGYSVRELCLHSAGDQLKKTQYTQPCLYVVNALRYYAERSRNVHPDCVAGHSLGEYNALHAAGAFDFFTGLRLVQYRGQLMGRMGNGKMAAVVGLSADTIRRTLDAHGLTSLDIANYNTHTQFVISGPESDIAAARLPLESAGASLYVPLPVSGAFHSRYMRTAREEFQRFLGTFAFSEPEMPVVSNVTGQFYPARNGDEATKALLAAQISEPVKWEQGVCTLLDSGVKTFAELGPGSVLSRLIQQIQTYRSSAVL
jgi:malonyl CoA-acyl carrier protein transacylase